MPAEIDTGGPRVLHCDYRADCPIPIVVSASNTESSVHRQERNRVIPLLRSSIVRRLSRIDENQLHADDGPVKSRSSTCLPSHRRTIRYGLRGYRRRFSKGTPAVLNVPNDYDVAPNFLENDRDSAKDTSRLEERLESRLCNDIKDSEIPCTIKEKCFRTKYSLEEKRFRQTGNIGSNKETTENPSANHDCSEERLWSSKSDIPVRDRTLRDTANTACVGIRKSFFSSHCSRSTSRDRTYEKIPILNIAEHSENGIGENHEKTNSWMQFDSRVDGIESVNRQNLLPRLNENTTSSSHIRRKNKRACPKSRSYFQLAFLLFLVAFGQSGLLRSSVFHFSAIPSTTGLSVLAIYTVIGAVSAAPVDLMADAGVRAERSANLSHITGASRKIQMYIKNRHLQILPDGTVNGSNDDTSDYTIFQRTSVSRGQLRIQGVATCLYLCMDSCGLLYGSREYTEDCVFNETLEQHNYNTYSSVRWSTTKKTLYLGLNRRGQPRRVQAKGHNLGRLSAYARVLTQVAPPDRVEALQRRMLGAHHNVRHRHNSHVQHHHRTETIQQSLCPTLPAQEKDGRDRFRCRKRKKRKKRKRRCRPGEKPGPQCQISEETKNSTSLPMITEVPGDEIHLNKSSLESKRSCEGAASEEACRREALTVPSKKRKLRVEEVPMEGGSAILVNRNVTSNGKNKAPVSNTKKINVAGSMSQSKKPNLTDGKKRKRKGPPVRRNPLPQGRKKFGLGRTDNTSAVPTATTAPAFTTFSSYWSHPPGVSTVPTAGVGKGISPRLRTKITSSPKNDFGRTVNPQRRLGKAISKPFVRIKSVAKTTSTASVHETTTIADHHRQQSLTVQVPEPTVSDRLSSNLNLSSVQSSDEITEETSRSMSDSSILEDDQSSTVLNEYVTSTIDSTSVTLIDVTTVPTIFRLTEEESSSVEDVSNDDNDEDDDDGRFEAPETNKPTTPRFPLERLAM